MIEVLFNIPSITGKEKQYVCDVIDNYNSSDIFSFADRSRQFLQNRWGYGDIFLTNSCTAALEISALLIGIKPLDEVIIPSFTFTSTAASFARHGAKIICVDSRSDHPGINEDAIEYFISEKTKAIVPVHYGGVACDMDKIMKTAEKYDIAVVEDAAHALGAYYKDKALGSIGHIGCISFHRSKNIQCGEGGAIIVNNKKYLERITYIMDKGTNKKDFFEGRIKQYGWKDLGSSYRINELNAAFLLAQLEESDILTTKRQAIWNEYFQSLLSLREKGLIGLPVVRDYANHNAHLFYIILENELQRDGLREFLAEKNIESSFHYLPITNSDYWKENSLSETKNLNSLKFHDCLLRLPLFNGMTREQVSFVVTSVKEFFQSES